MQNKKITMVVMSFISIAAFILAYYVILDRKKDKDNPGAQTAQEDKSFSLPKASCSDMSDGESYKKAIEEKNIDFCVCVKDDSRRELCQDAMTESGLADQALAQLDKSICSEIKDVSRREGCVSAVDGSVEFLKKNDLRKLIGIYVVNHNDKAIELIEGVSDKDISSYISLAKIYAEQGLAAQEGGADRKIFLDKALSSIDKAKSLDANNSEIYRMEAYVNEIKPDYDQAKILYGKALELDGKNILAYAGRGHVNRMMGMLDLAMDDFNKAAELDVRKENSFVYVNLCNLENSRSNFKEALKNCEMAVKNEKSSATFKAEAYQLMSDIALKSGDIVQAKNYLLKAKSLNPNDSNLLAALSRVNIFEKKYQEAETNARKAIELSATKSSAHLALSHALYMNEKFNESIEIAQKGLSLVDNDVSLLSPAKNSMKKSLNNSIANNYRQMGNLDKQKEYEEKAAEFTNK